MDPRIQIAGAVVLALVVLTSFGIVVYLAGSFALMRPHAEGRALRASWRALVTEALWVVVTQPLMPLFYLLGHRLDAGWLARALPQPEGPPIVLVHGYMHNRVGFVGLARALARRGRGPIFAINYPWFASIESNAVRLTRFVDDVIHRTGSPRVDLVCHSMGGLIAMEMMRLSAASGAAPVRRCVTIATPHAGVAWRGPILGVGGASLRRGSKLLAAQAEQKLAVPCLSIFSTHDNVVHPKDTSRLMTRGGRDLEVPEVAHLSILFSPRVAEAVAAFLGEPDPARAAGEPPKSAPDVRWVEAAPPRSAAPEASDAGEPKER
jgi:pimeloyl-ACP methyl ester carboxylesterase